MEKKDYYEVLDIHRKATKEEIRKAYRQKARLLHPDVNPNDPDATDRFKELSEAYQVLNDDYSRAAYDQIQENIEIADTVNGEDFQDTDSQTDTHKVKVMSEKELRIYKIKEKTHFILVFLSLIVGILYFKSGITFLVVFSIILFAISYLFET